MLKRIFSVILATALILCLFGCGGDNIFTCLDLNLTLPDGYYEADAGEGANMLLTNGESTVTVKRLSVIDAEEDGISGSYSAKQFAEFFLKNSGINGTVASKGDVPYYSYYEDSGVGGLFCISAFYRTPYAYFIVIFATDRGREADARVEFFDIMASATFNLN